uniref:Uncharacterized protein n=1 Tax=viral metagenome TaxID=1070528 RepID=A0A6M3MEY4_9ZZZZ
MPKTDLEITSDDVMSTLQEHGLVPEKEPEIKEPIPETKETLSESGATPREEPSKPPVTEIDWKTFGDGVNTYDDAINKYKNVSNESKTLKEQREILSKENEKLMKEMQSVRSEIDDPDLFRLNKIKKENPDQFNVYAKIVLNKDGLSAIDLLKLKFIKDNPQFSDKPEKAEQYLRHKYSIDLDELNSEDFEEPEVNKRKQDIEMNKMNLEVDANSVKREILNEFNKIELPKKAEPVNTDELKANWNPIVTELVNQFNELPIMVRGINDKEPKEFMKFVVAPEQKQKFINLVNEYVVTNNMPFTKESLTQAAQFLMVSFQRENQYHINNSILQKARSMEAEEWEKFTNNPSALKPQERQPKSVSEYQESVEKTLAAIENQ